MADIDISVALKSDTSALDEIEQRIKALHKGTIDLNFNSDIKYIKKSSVSNNSMMDNLW